MINLMQKIAALLLGLVSSAALALIYLYPTPWIFFLVCGVWCVLIILAVFTSRHLSRQWHHVLPLSLVTAGSCTGLFLLMEWQLWQVFLIVFVGVAMTLLFGWSVPDENGILPTHKPFRRMKVMLWVFDAYALITMLFGVGIFLPKIPLWLLHGIGGVILGGISYMIWRMYYDAIWQRFALWILLTVVIMVEVIWVIQLLPFAYLVSGLLIVWIWYILQLLIRFHIGPQDVVWRRQRLFLGINAMLFAGILYIARWV